MPIGKSAIKRITNNGYSQVESKAPDMENSTVATASVEPVVTEVAEKKAAAPKAEKAEKKIAAPKSEKAEKKVAAPKAAKAEKKAAAPKTEKAAAPKTEKAEKKAVAPKTAKKTKTAAQTPSTESTATVAAAEPAPVKRGPGRPRKNPDAPVVQKTPKKPGPKKKTKEVALTAPTAAPTETSERDGFAYVNLGRGEMPVHLL